MLEKLKQDIYLKLSKADYFKDFELPKVDFTAAPAHTGADLSLTWALAAAKQMHKRPLEIAQEAAQLISELTAVKTATAVAPGFVNITLENSFIIKIASDRRIKDPAHENSRQNILIEFVSANPTGPLHVASGRGASLGDSLVKIHRALGYSCDSEYYVNDAGNQAELLAVSLKARKEGKEPPENGYHGSYLVELAKRIPADLPEEQYGRWAMEELIKTQQQDMKDYHVDFTRWFRESDLHQSNAVESALKDLTKQGYTYKKEDAVWFGSTKDEEAQDDKDRVLVRKDGRPTYFMADIAYHKNKYDRGYTTLIDILGADHHGYVPRMKAAVKALGHEEKTFVPIIHQLVHLTEHGEQVKMSKRAGHFITLRELMDDVGTDACRFFFASRTPNAHMLFDMDLAKKRTNENPVFYVQYVHARIHSIFKAAAEEGFTKYDGITTELAPQERALLLKLVWFKQVLHNCVADLSPHHLTTYLVELAGLFHAFYDTCHVVDKQHPELTRSRLFICQRVAERIKKGLEFIGVSAPEQM